MLRTSIARLTAATAAVGGSSLLLSQSRKQLTASNSSAEANHGHIQHAHAMNPLPVESPAPGKQFVPKLLQIVHRHGARSTSWSCTKR